MKVNKEKLEELLKALNLKDVEVVDGDGDEVVVDDLVKQVDEARGTVIRPQITEAVKSEVEGAFKGKMFGTIKAAFNKSGIKLTEEYSTVDDLIKKALEEYGTKFSKDTEGLRDEIKRLTDDHATAVGSLKDQYEKQLKDEKDKFIDKDIEEILQGVINEIPRVGGDAITQAKQAKQYLRENYHLFYNDKDRKLEIRSKDNPEQLVYNEQKTKIKEVNEVVKEFCDKIGIVASDTRHTNPLDAMKNGNNPVGAVNKSNQNLTPMEANTIAINKLLDG